MNGEINGGGLVNGKINGGGWGVGECEIKGVGEW